jgi:hypothetical protein
MQHCEFCGSALPVNARFCGNCGRLLPDGSMSAIDITYPPEAGNAAPQTPPLFSSPSYPDLHTTGMGWEDTDATFRTRWSTADMESVTPQFTDRKSDENGVALPDLLLPGMLAMQRQIPSSAQAPMVQGTPQIGGVPSVQGTPAAPGNAPPSVPGLAHSAGSSAPSYAPQEAQSFPLHHPQPSPSPHKLDHHHTGPLRAHRPRTSSQHSSVAVTSKAGMGVASKWLIVVLAAVVVIATSSILLTHAFMPATPPGITITGTNVVRGGGILHLHGQGFQPGGSVILTIDNGLPVSLAGQHGTQDISQGTERNANVTGFSQMFIAGALQPRSADTNITVRSSGTFDANVTVPLSLPAGQHSIHATVNHGSQSASLHFTVSSPAFAVNPTALNFGSVEFGRTVKLSVTVSNLGGTRINWTAAVAGSNTNWLTLSNSTGVVETNGSDKTVTVTANTNGLSVGPHSATLRIHSDNGDVQIAVKINVIPVAQSGQQAILNVPQQNLDFGQLQVGQQVRQSFSIANLGNLPLKWQASSDTAGATWLSLATTSGTVQPGAAPQTVGVTVNTTGLAAGSYNGTLNITSNGGNAKVLVTFGVTPVTPTSTPPTWSVGPTSLNSSACSVSAPCTLTLTEDASSSANIDWTPSSDVGANFNPPNGTLTPGAQQKVSVSGMACQNGTFTFNGSAGANPLKVSWSCTPPPTPKITVTPQNIDPTSSNCSQNSDGTYSCTVTVGETSPGELSWFATVSIGGTGTSINPQKGQLTASQTQQTLKISSIPCQKGSFSFIDQNKNTANISWSCTPTKKTPPPTLTVTPTSLSDLQGGPCTFDQASATWSCTVQVMETSDSQGTLTWSASSSMSGVSFSASSNTNSLSPGQSASVTISKIPCVSSGTFTFSGGANPVPVSWSCGS